MPRQTLSNQLRMAHIEITRLREELAERDRVIAEQRIKLNYMNTTERRFDQLLDAMSMGMKEANLPRRPV